MRYFAEIAYNGTHYCGWQKQPNAPSVQATIENTLSTILREPIEIVGCGRTDTGVHASQYFIHFDYSGILPEGFLSRVNKFLPKDIAVYNIMLVHAEANVRYDASYRKYAYYLSFQKNPFTNETCYHFPFESQLDLQKLQVAAALLLEYEDFFPFCKTNTEVKTMKVFLNQSEWQVINQGLVYHIAANRFLRGMVRLIVGMCLNVGMGKLSIETVKEVLERQTRLDKSWSVPPQGLFLEEIRYTYI